jgi:hypothetical protein
MRVWLTPRGASQPAEHVRIVKRSCSQFLFLNWAWTSANHFESWLRGSGIG